MNISKSRKVMYIISTPKALIITLILFVIGMIILLSAPFSTTAIVFINIFALPFGIHILLIQLLFWFDFFTQLSRKNRLEIKKLKEIKNDK